MDVLTTMNVCINDTTPTIFCDEKRYNIIPFHMVKVILQQVYKKNTSRDTKMRAQKSLRKMP